MAYEGKVIVSFREGTSEEGAREVLRKHTCLFLDSFTPLLGVGKISCPNGKEAEVCEALQRHPEVEHARPE